jgi:GNAT superfamily N-acetyltransferase
MCAIEEGGSFVGLAITLVYGEVALLDYFAIAPHRRGCGIGAAALDLLKKKYSGRALLIEIEDPDDDCDNPEIRRRRLSFYKRCGMNIMPYKVYFYGTKMLTLTSGGRVEYPAHVAVYENVLGDEVAANIVLCDE